MTPKTDSMNVWRLVAHHEQSEKMTEAIRRNGMIALGWGDTGDLREQSFADERELSDLVANAHHHAPRSNAVDGGRSLWRLYREMQIGDLVIISASRHRILTVRVTGGYFYASADDDDPRDLYLEYLHRRKTEGVPLDPNRIWQAAGGRAPGENPRWALIRCAHPCTEDEVRMLTR